MSLASHNWPTHQLSLVNKFHDCTRSVDSSSLTFADCHNICMMFLILKALVHVSTAYANCDRSVVSETIYPAPLLPKKIINAVE